MARKPMNRVEEALGGNGHAVAVLDVAAPVAAKDTLKEAGFILPQLDIAHIDLTLVGDSPLICNRWSEKAKRMILDKQMQKATKGREVKDPEKDFEASLYPHPDGCWGFPSIAFKNAAVTACTSLGKAITKVAARQAFHVMGELVKIDGTPTCRDDMVRVGMGTADIRFRGEFKEWKTTLRIRFNRRVLSIEQIMNLFNTAGFAVGVGEWRPEKDGQFGMFHTIRSDEI